MSSTRKKMTPEEKAEAARIRRIMRTQENEIRLFHETGQTDHQRFDKDGNLLPRISRTIWDVARAHGIPIDDILPEPRFDEDGIK